MIFTIRALFAALAVAALTASLSHAQAPSYSTLYDPLKLDNYFLTMSSTDWNTIKNDSSYTIEKPAYFNATGESKILISAKRKPTLVESGKVSLKLDINQYFGGAVWHGVKKLSLENGEGSGVLGEGLAWYLHGRAAQQVNALGFDYHPGKFTFANVWVNGVNQGIYTHVEQVDKTFLRNRDEWVSGETWLYKQQDINNTEFHEGPSATSPTRAALNYAPFVPGGAAPPSDAVLATQLPQYINMDAWLTMGAVNAFTANPDNLFAKGKNFWFIDYEDNTLLKRRYVPWDLDGVFTGGGTARSIYGSGAYHDLVLDHPDFRQRYNEIMLMLLNDSLSVSNLHSYLNELEPVLAGTTAGSFQGMRDWITLRHSNVLSQVQADMAAREAIVPEPATLSVLGAVGLVWLMRRSRARGVLAVTALITLSASPLLAQAPSYTSLYNPLQVQNLHLTMSSTDWNTIKSDTSYTTEKPAYFNATGESRILVAVRRKPTGVVGTKVSLKVDINEYFDGAVWHGVKKISLENGEGAGVLNEGMAWYLHGAAAQHVNQQGFDYRPGKFTFANVYVNGVNQGMYTHVEQPDKQFLRNRDQWVPGQTWLYKQQQPEITELHEGSTTLSPTRTTLNYFPFEFYGPPAPSDAVVEAQLPQLINMDAWLTMGAVNAFTGNGDMLFSKGKNFWFADYEDNGVMKRRYYPWDLDAVFSGSGVSRSIYAGSGGMGSGYVDMMFDIPSFRDRYNEIMLDLLNGPLTVANMHAYLNQLEPIAPGAGSYSTLRSWLTQRHANVLAQLQADMAAREAVIPEPGSAAAIGIGLCIAALRRNRRQGGVDA